MDMIFLLKNLVEVRWTEQISMEKSSMRTPEFLQLQSLIITDEEELGQARPAGSSNITRTWNQTALQPSCIYAR